MVTAEKHHFIRDLTIGGMMAEDLAIVTKLRTHPASLSVTHISDGAFALSESFVILFVTPIRGGVTDEWGEGSQYIRLA